MGLSGGALETSGGGTAGRGRPDVRHGQDVATRRRGSGRHGRGGGDRGGVSAVQEKPEYERSGQDGHE